MDPEARAGAKVGSDPQATAGASSARPVGGGVPADPGGPVLAIRDLAVRFGELSALEGVSLAVAPGEQVAVVGPNGAGKSTLFKAILGLVPHAAGEIRVHGHAAGADTCVAYVPQRSQVDFAFPLSVADVVMMGRVGHIGLLRRPGAEDRARVRACLAQVRLEGLADRPIGALSGGQQQRMFIARALAQEAELVLLDEPLSGLDARSEADVLAVLDALHAQGVAVLVATHDLALAAERFDRVLLLSRRQIAFGLPEAVLTEANLLAAYGGHVRVADTGEGRLIVGDLGWEGHPGVAGPAGEV